MKKSAFFQRTIILTASNILTGILTFIFSIILSREIGPKGMGVYQLVMPLYNMFLFITGGGITVTISKIAAEKKASGNMKELYRTVKVVCIFELFWSILITAVVFFLSGFISGNILSDRRTVYGIMAFCPALVIISLSSVLKGTYYGIQRIVEPAFIDIIEKIVRISIMFPLILLTKNIGIEYSSAAAVLSLSCGEFISLLLFYICYKLYVKKHIAYGKCDNDFQLLFNVLKLAVPLALNGILSTIFSTVITVLIPKRLQSAGIPYEEALSLLGRLQGMALNIAFFPTVIIGALNILIIPSISEAVTYKKDFIINHRINTSLRVASIAAFSSAAIIMCIPELLGQFFYKDTTVGSLLRVISPTIPLVYIEVTTFAILNGLGKQNNILINSTIINICEIILLYIILGIPSLNIYGYALSFAATAILALCLNFRIIGHTIEYKPDIFNALVLPLGCSVVVFFIMKIYIISVLTVPLIILSGYILYMILYIPMFELAKRRY